MTREEIQKIVLEILVLQPTLDAEKKYTDQLLQLHQEKSTTKLQSSLAQIQGKIDYCEGRVDELVYELYGLTEEERKVVEGA